MDNLMDHKPTDEELVGLFGDAVWGRTTMAMDHGADWQFMALARLYGLRGDTARRDAYVAKIKDVDERFELELLFAEEA